jgi:hypothetical protein
MAISRCPLRLGGFPRPGSRPPRRSRGRIDTHRTESIPVAPILFLLIERMRSWRLACLYRRPQVWRPVAPRQHGAPTPILRLPIQYAARPAGGLAKSGQPDKRGGSGKISVRDRHHRPQRSPRSREYETEADPHARREVEAHPGDLGSPFAPAVSHPPTLESVLQPSITGRYGTPLVLPCRHRARYMGTSTASIRRTRPRARGHPDPTQDPDVRRHVSPAQAQAESHEGHHQRPEDLLEGVAEVIRLVTATQQCAWTTTMSGTIDHATTDSSGLPVGAANLAISSAHCPAKQSSAIEHSAARDGRGPAAHSRSEVVDLTSRLAGYRRDSAVPTGPRCYGVSTTFPAWPASMTTSCARAA